jgi:NHLM bacteriocin system ABC transporter ATP-binding protein
MFGLQGQRHDVKRLLVVLVISSLLGLILPISIGLIFDHVIPNADFDLLSQFVVALAVSSLSISIFYTAERVATTRLKLRMNATLQAAVWDRLLRLPVSFFKKYSAGDLSDRASGIDEIQHTISGNLVTNILAGMFSVLSLALMFYYDFRLAAAAVLLASLYVGVNIAATLRQLPHQRARQQLEGENLGFLVQVLTGITKLRVSNRGITAFRLWLGKFIRTTRLFMRAERIRIRLFVFSSILSVLVTASLFALVVTLEKALTLGSFMALNALYGQFFASMIAISGAISSSLEVIPLYERAKPILDTLPETASSGVWVGGLNGNIEIDRISFRYADGKTAGQQSELPLLFANLQITIAAGEFVALTGPSGCGKSTLFRLLLGLEKPLSGSIHYGGTSLTDIDVRSLRSRIGVVLQNSTLMPGTILENILYGGLDLSEEHAWTAARLACVDKEIECLPMGMHTYISESGKNFSGGQRQRILIARALVKAPKILFLDEATSAMDNDTQAGIIEHILDSRVTCIVAAHRLSTVQGADRILVLDKGNIVQEGGFNELVAKPGLFSQMSRRQFL